MAEPDPDDVQLAVERLYGMKSTLDSGGWDGADEMELSERAETDSSSSSIKTDVMHVICNASALWWFG